MTKEECKFETISEEEKKNFKEIKIKIPKNTIAFIVSFLERDIYNGNIRMGTLSYDTNDIEEYENKE